MQSQASQFSPRQGFSEVPKQENGQSQGNRQYVQDSYYQSRGPNDYSTEEHNTPEGDPHTPSMGRVGNNNGANAQFSGYQYDAADAHENGAAYPQLRGAHPLSSNVAMNVKTVETPETQGDNQEEEFLLGNEVSAGLRRALPFDFNFERKLNYAYLIWFFLGWLGAHQLYTRRWAQFFYYILWVWFLCQLSGGAALAIFIIPYVGMLIYDGFRMKRFVNLANSHADVRKANCMQLADIYQFWCYPWGIWGFHHLYMRNYWQFFIYLFTFGGFGAGWALDLCRIKNQYWPEIMRNGPRPPFWVKSGYSERNKSDMFWSWLPFGGWIGLHHFYSGDIFLGMCYFMSFGLWGIGWIVDCCRLSSWVDRFNKGIAKQVEEIRTRRLQEAAQQRNVKVGEEALAEATGLEDDEKMSVPSVVTDGSAPAAGMDHAEMAAIYKQVRRPKFAKSNFDGYLTWLASMGYLGMHHLYLQDFTLFFLHIVSLGGFGIMWIADLFLMPWFVDRANAKLGFSTPDDVPEMITGVATRIDRTIGEDDSERRAQKKRSLYICYLLWCPMYGFIGLYYLYLGKYKSFLVRFLTMNFFFVGWIIDACRMPALVNKFHEEQEAELHSSNAVFISHVDQPDNMNTTGAEQGLRQRGV